MKRKIALLLLIFFIVFLPLILLSFLPSSYAQTYKVEHVVDGDTLLLTNGEYVRLIGVDTPETKHPEKPVERFGKEVRLEYDQTRRDRYNRILADVYLMDGTFLNAEIIKLRDMGLLILNTPSSIWRSLGVMRERQGKREEGCGGKGYGK